MNYKRWLFPLAAVAGAVAVYGVLIEPRWIQVRRSRIHSRRVPYPFHGLRIALLTDLHAGGMTTLGLIRRAASFAMRERPDLIALTGDFTTDKVTDFTPVLDALSALSAPMGVYAVPGNHDHVVGIDKWKSAIAQTRNINDLTNAYAVHEAHGARLCIAGVDDYYCGKPELRLPPMAERDFTILLAHSPDQGERVRRRAERRADPARPAPAGSADEEEARADDHIDLVLSGHTHGGQIRVPGFRAPVSSSDFPELYEDGLRRRPWTQVYTSRGVGTIGVPIRIGTRPEVAILELSNLPRPRKPGPNAGA